MTVSDDVSALTVGGFCALDIVGWVSREDGCAYIAGHSVFAAERCCTLGLDERTLPLSSPTAWHDSGSMRTNCT